jgi:hypothetical protein
LRSWNGIIPLEQFLAEQRVDILYLDPSELGWLRPQPRAQNMLDNPRDPAQLTSLLMRDIEPADLACEDVV